MQFLSQIQYDAVKRVLKYLRGTLDYGIWYFQNEEKKLQGYSGSDFAGSVDDSKSTHGYTFSLVVEFSLGIQGSKK